MTMQLEVYFPGMEKPIFGVPIVPAQQFKEKWLSLFDGMELRWVNRFPEGIVIHAKDVEQVIRELEAMKGYLRDVTLPMAMGMNEVITYADRLDNVIMALGTLRSMMDGHAEIR